MSSDSALSEFDIGLPIDDRINILFQELELAIKWDRPSILFAIYNSDSIRDEVNLTLQKKLEEIGQKIHFVKTNDVEKFTFLSQISQLSDLFQTVVVIDGFSWECGKEGVRVFQEFNNYREFFIDNNIRAIFWLFESEVSDFATNATECWILRHRVVDFVDNLKKNERSSKPFGKNCVCKNKSVRDEVDKDIILDNPMNTSARDEKKASRAISLLGLGMLFWRKGNSHRSLKYLQKAVELSSSLTDNSLQAQVHNALALVYTEMGNINEAIASYIHAISHCPESENLWSNLGHLYAKLERNEEALSAYKKALSLSSSDFISWDGAGQIYNKFGAYQNAIEAYEKALNIAPYYEYSWAGLGKAFLAIGETEKAQESLCKAVEINPHFIDAWKDLGECYRQQDHELDAIASYEKALETNPGNAQIILQLGKLRLQRRDLPESISALKMVVTLDPQCGEAYLDLANALFQVGDYEASASLYEESLPLFDGSTILSDIWSNLGDCFMQLKEYEKAISAYTQSNQLQKEIQDDDGNKVSENGEDPNENPIKVSEDKNSENERGEEMMEANEVYDLKTAAEWNENGHSHLRAGEYNEAIVAYTKAIELAPDACWPYIRNLAHVHFQKGKALGGQSVGEMQDPDILEEEEEAEGKPISSVGLESISTENVNDTRKEPGLEKQPDKSNVSITDGDVLGEMTQIDSTSGLNVEHQANPKKMHYQDEVFTSISYDDNTEIKNQEGLDVEKDSTAVDVPSTSEKENTFEKAIDWNELGLSLINSRKYDDAIEAFKNAIEMDPDHGVPYCNLGYTYYLLGKYEVAILLYKKSIDRLDLPEEIAASWNRLGDAYRRLGDYGNALSAYQQGSEKLNSLRLDLTGEKASLTENAVIGFS